MILTSHQYRAVIEIRRCRSKSKREKAVDFVCDQNRLTRRPCALHQCWGGRRQSHCVRDKYVTQYFMAGWRSYRRKAFQMGREARALQLEY